MENNFLSLNGLTVRSDQSFLILEDESDVSETIVDHLEFLGFNGTFFQAFSIADAQEVLKNNKIDYILSDWNLPDGKGIALLKAVRKTPRLEATPFLMVTGNSDIDSMVTSSKIGVSEYLVKPFSIEEFQEKIVEGWKYHLIKGEKYLKSLEEKVLKLEQENLELKKRLDK